MTGPGAERAAGGEPTPGAPEPTPDGPVRLETTAVRARAARRREQARPVAGRTAALVAVAAVVLGVAAVSALAPPPAAAPIPSTADGVAVAPVDAHASSFFCATGAGTDAGAGATASVILTNTTHSAAVGVESAVSETAGPVRTGVTVPALGSVVVNPAAGLGLSLIHI